MASVAMALSAQHRHRLRGGLPECALAVAALAAWLFIQRIALMADVTWQFWIARQLLGGTRLYRQIWEVNPPLWFWSAVPLEWLAERLGLDWSRVATTFIVVLGMASALLVDRLVELEGWRERTLLLLTVFLAVIVIPIAYTGQREQILLAGCLPYAALIARRHAGRATPVALAVGVGLLGAFGFAFKHYFLLVPLALELWLGLRLGRAWRPWRPELLVLATAGVAYAVSVLAFAPEFLSVMVPMVNAAYGAGDATLFHMLYRPDVFFWVLAAASLWLFRNRVRPHANAVMAAFAGALPVLAAALVVVYLLPHKSWGYHTAPATGAMAVAVSQHLARSTRPVQRVFYLALLGWAVVGIYPVEWPVRSFGRYIDRVPQGETLFVASTDAGVAWPAVERRGLVWGSRSYSLWMTAALFGDGAGGDAAALARLAGQTLSATSEDIRCSPPWLLQIQRVAATPGDPAGLAMQRFLLGDAGLQQFVARHYVRLPDIPGAIAYQRRGPVAGMTGPNCRTIR
jgi:hypothetical protein